MKYVGMPMGMWMVFHRSFQKNCRSLRSQADGVTEFVREYTLASGGPYCDCGYKKKKI